MVILVIKKQRNIREHHALLGPTHQLEEDLFLALKCFNKLLDINQGEYEVKRCSVFLQALNDKFVVLRSLPIQKKTAAIIEIRHLLDKIAGVVIPIIESLNKINKTLAKSARLEIDKHLQRLHKEVEKQIRDTEKDL